MLLKKFIKGLSYALMIGACLILGFLSFSGVYILAPILPLAVVVFFLAVLFEGEIYYQNISKAIKSLLKPKYLESRVAEDCLCEAVLDIQNTEKSIKMIDEFEQKLRDFEEMSTADEAKTKAKKKELLKTYKKLLEQYNKHNKQAKNTKLRTALTNIELSTEQEFESILNNQESPENQRKKRELLAIIGPLRRTMQSEQDCTPTFIKDYARLSVISHKYSHLNLNTQGKAEKESINVGLSILEKVFAEQLFAEEPKQKGLRNPETKQTDEERKLAEYKEELRSYLAERYKDEYIAKLNGRRPVSIFNKILSTVCGAFMILGTSYLLVEAFTIIPLLSAIPFGILPIVVIPLSIIAGTAYGIITYRALDEMLNNDVITKRWAKIKEDWNNGLTLYTGAKLVGFLLLLGLAIVLTVCTGGTWYTVVKHTKPIFSWLSKIPSAVSGVIAGFLAVAALAFNISNSMQTGEEIEEFFENEAPEDHPLNIDLLTIEEGKDVNSSIEFAQRTAIIKQGDDYYIHCCKKGYKDRDDVDNDWERIKIEKDSYLAKQLSKLKFANNVLYYNAKNSLIYNLIRLKTAHKFKASNENWWQYFNPFRIFLYVTYVPLKLLFFIGHLISISATADRIPGIPEIVSMFVGFVAELFEDLHYFAGMEHPHKHDVASIVEERLKGEGDHDHNNDLPSRLLRDYLFIPFFWLAAHYHSWASDRVPVNEPSEEQPEEAPAIHILDRIILHPIQFIYNKIFRKGTETPTDKPSLSFDIAYAQMKGTAPKSKPKLNEVHEDEALEHTEAETNVCSDNELVRSENGIKNFIDGQMDEHKKKVLDRDDLVEVQAANDKFVKEMLLKKPRPSSFSMFAHRHGHDLLDEEMGTRNRVLLVH